MLWQFSFDSLIKILEIIIFIHLINYRKLILEKNKRFQGVKNSEDVKSGEAKIEQERSKLRRYLRNVVLLNIWLSILLILYYFITCFKVYFPGQIIWSAFITFKLVSIALSYYQLSSGNNCKRIFALAILNTFLLTVEFMFIQIIKDQNLKPVETLGFYVFSELFLLILNWVFLFIIYRIIRLKLQLNNHDLRTEIKKLKKLLIKIKKQFFYVIVIFFVQNFIVYSI